MTLFYGYFCFDGTELLYVGKAKGERTNRSKDHLKNARGGVENYFYNKLRQMLREGRPIRWEVVFESDNEAEVFVWEREMIKKYGRRDLGTGILYNGTDGGDGFCGGRHTAEWKKLNGDRMRMRGGFPVEFRLLGVEANRGAVRSPEQRAKMSKGQRGAPRPNYTKEKHRAARHKMWDKRDEAERQRIVGPALAKMNGKSSEERVIAALKASNNNLRNQRVNQFAIEIYLTRGTCEQLAKRFDVGMMTVSRIKRGVRGFEWVAEIATKC